MTSELFIGHLPSQGCPTTAALMPQNFTAIDLRHHFAAGGGLLDGLHGVAVVQGIAKIQILSFFQQVAVGGDLNLQLDLVVHHTPGPGALPLFGSG